MTGRTSILGILRRRRASVGRVVLALFVLASASAAAAPCLAMAPSATSAAHQHAASPSESHDHSHSAAHDHSALREQPDGTHQQPTPCQHCPLSVGMAGDGSTISHALCSATDDVAEGGKPSAPPASFKTIVPVPLGELLPVDPGYSLAREKQRPPDATAAAVALNLRHCVFLI